jgi:hypothetical protein
MPQTVSYVVLPSSQDDQRVAAFTSWQAGMHEGVLPITSMKILLSWMLEEGNYTRYCGKDNYGVGKNAFSTMLVQTMTAETKSFRNANHVKKCPI